MAPPSVTAVLAVLLSTPLRADGFFATDSFFNGIQLRAGAAAQQQNGALKMVAAPEKPTISAPTTADQFANFVQKTYGRYPLTMVRGKGCKLYDDTGKEYLDFVAGIATCALGHSHEGLNKAISDQMSQMHHVSNLYYIPQQGQLAQFLVEHSCADRVFFCNSGAEANEAAIKLARKYGHEKLGLDVPVVITAHQSFHGRTLATITATGQPKYQKGFAPLMPGFEYTTYNDVDELRQLVKKINFRGALRGAFGMGKRGVAAIMMEALQGEGGVVPATPEFFKAIREICDETGAIMICDEVQVGMGRSGALWGFENLGVQPDVFSSAKALGGGVPIGAMLCKAKFDVFQPGDHASTYGGNPLACAAGLAVAKALTEGGVLQNVKARGEQLRRGLDLLVEKYPEDLAGVRGWGLIDGLIIKPEASLVASQVVGAATELGLLLVPAGPKVVRMVPPLIVSEAEIALALSRLDSALAKARAVAAAAK